MSLALAVALGLVVALGFVAGAGLEEILLERRGAEAGTGAGAVVVVVGIGSDMDREEGRSRVDRRSFAVIMSFEKSAKSAFDQAGRKEKKDRLFFSFEVRESTDVGPWSVRTLISIRFRGTSSFWQDVNLFGCLRPKLVHIYSLATILPAENMYW